MSFGTILNHFWTFRKFRDFRENACRVGVATPTDPKMVGNCSTTPHLHLPRPNSPISPFSWPQNPLVALFIIVVAVKYFYVPACLSSPYKKFENRKLRNWILILYMPMFCVIWDNFRSFLDISKISRKRVSRRSRKSDRSQNGQELFHNTTPTFTEA